MRILHITKKYPRALGGDAVAVSNLEKQQLKARHKVVVLTSNCDEIAADARHHKFGLRDTPAALDNITPRRLLSLAALVAKSFRLIRKERPDVVHTHSVDMAFAASFAARWYKVPLVHTFHILTFPDPHHSALRRKTELWFLRGARPRVVTAPNQTDVAHLQKAGVANAALLPYGMDLDFWRKTRTVKHNTFTFVTAARLEEQKGNAYLIRAAALLKKKSDVPFKVVVVGDGSQKDELVALAAQLHISSQVEFVGRKTPEEVRALYEASDAAVIPSLWESGPLTAFEAWAMKLPLIITPVGMFATEPKDTKRLVLVEPADAKSLAAAMESLLADGKKRAALARAGYQAVQQHSWAEMRKTADAIYKKAQEPAGGVAVVASLPAAVRAAQKPAQEVAAQRPAAFKVRASVLMAGLGAASVAALCLAPMLSPTINTLVTLPLVVLVPGLLALLAGWPEQGEKPAAAAALAGALGLLLIAVESALLNWLLPLVSTAAPLQAKYLVPLHALATLALLGAYLKKRGRDKRTVTLPLRFNGLRALRALLPLLLPLLASLGAFRQNNGASNTLTIFGFSLTAVFAAWFVWKPKLWNASWLLFNMALGLLLSTSLRSWFISGFDISQEFQVFSATLQNHYWAIHALPGNAYNACLSLTTLPTALQQFTGVGAEVIFKYFYQVVFALTAVVTYTVGRRFVGRRLAFMAALLYAAQTEFIGTMPAIARQEIGLLFFGLIVYLLLGKARLGRAGTALLGLLSLGMVLTHYSTTYLAVMIFAASAFAVWAAQKIPTRLPKLKLPTFETHFWAGVLGGLALVLVVLSTLWYGTINASSSNVVDTLKGAVHLQLPDLHSSKSQLLLGGDQEAANPENVAKYAAAQKLHVPLTPAAAPKLHTGNTLLATAVNLGRDAVSVVLKLLLPLAPLLLLARKKTRKDSASLALVGLGAVAVFVAVIAIPQLTISYNLQRVYQQCLIVLGVAGLWALWQLLPVGRQLKTVAVATFVIGFFVLSPGTGLVNQLSGGSAPRLSYNSYGEEYDKYFVRESDVLGAQWLAQHCAGQAAWADRYATLRVAAYAHVPYDAIRNDIFNAKKGCLYLDYANVHDNLYYTTYQQLPVRFTTPGSSFSQYNLIYSNGQSEVYAY
ncbi:MAG TPA: glycosyltransferase [Candidatus Saccharimonadales bacterium]|nr:glycosyltransferase [Candidatus Saccharimonadales bacterium]